jgi:hypothetical protein
MRWGALLKLALGAVAMQVYCAPLRVLKREYVNVDANEVVEQQRRQEERLYEQYQDVLFLRMWLMFAVSLYALSGVVAKQVVVGAYMHCTRYGQRFELTGVCARNVCMCSVVPACSDPCGAVGLG